MSSFFSRLDIQLFIPYLLHYKKLRFRITAHPYIKSKKVNARSLNSCIFFPFSLFPFPTLLLQVQDGSARSVCKEAFLLGNWIPYLAFEYKCPLLHAVHYAYPEPSCFFVHPPFPFPPLPLWNLDH